MILRLHERIRRMGYKPTRAEVDEEIRALEEIRESRTAMKRAERSRTRKKSLQKIIDYVDEGIAFLRAYEVDDEA